MALQVERYGVEDVGAWHQARGTAMAIGDVVDATNGESMSVGFARYARGAANPWTVGYDEALVIIKGVFTVEAEGDARTATAGEVIFLRRGTTVVYRAEEDAEVVFVTYPHWLAATQASEQLAGQLDEYDEIPAGEALRIGANVSG
jgi:ethanolamine utilization protein EutQ